MQKTAAATSPLIYSKIAAVVRDIEAVEKNRRNDQQNYKFRGIDDFLNALNPLFGKHEIFVLPEVIEQKREERASKNGGVLNYTLLTVKFHLVATDGSEVTSTMIGEGMDSGDKSSNKAMSTAFKYMVAQVFCVPTDEPAADPEVHSPAPKPRAAAKPTSPAGPAIAPKTAPAAPAPNDPPTQAMLKKLFAVATAEGPGAWKKDQIKEYMTKRWGIDSTKMLSRAMYDQLLEIVDVKTFPAAMAEISKKDAGGNG